MKYYSDSENYFKQFFNQVKESYLKDDLIHHASIRYSYWTGKRNASDGRPIMGESKIPSMRERDLYSIDFDISLSLTYWQSSSIAGKVRLALHELLHCVVIEDKKMADKPAIDKEGRLKVRLRHHDINLNLFFAEIRTLGLSSDESIYLQKLNDIVQDVNKQIKRGY